jgi:soluble lytic murein transglycosylase
VLRLLLILVLALTGVLRANAALADTASLSDRDKAIYQQAFAAAANDRWKEARRLAAKAKNKLPAKVLQWLDLTRPGPGRSFDEMTQFYLDNPGWPLRDTLQAQGERAMPSGYPANSVLKWFGEREPQTAEGALQLVGALRATKQIERAKRVAEAAWINEDFDSDEAKTFLDACADLLDQADHVARLDRLLWDNERDQAMQMLPRVDEGHRIAARARMKLADQVSDALGLLAQVPKELRREPGLVFEVARYLRRQGAYEKAAKALDPPPANPLRPERMWDEFENAARDALERGDVTVAYRLAASHGADSGRAFAEGEWLAGWIALRFLAETDTASKHFTSMYAGVDSVISQARGAYWAGRAADEKGDMAAAADWYRAAAKNMTTYYGQLAAERLGEKMDLHLQGPVKPAPADRAAFEKKELVKIVRLLGAIGEKDRVRPFLLKLMSTAGKAIELHMIAALAREIRRDDLAILVAKEARQRGVEMTDYLFPMIKIPLNGEPEPAFTLGIIRQESAFDAKAVSPAGAVGLMQMLPSTAKPIAKDLKIKKFKDKQLLDPATNITLGRAYLSKLVSHFKGSYILATAAYNAGPSRVQEWIYTYGDPRQAGTDVVDWIESIPFDETRNYVQRVMENLQVYRSRLNKGTARLALEADLRRSEVN